MYAQVLKFHELQLLLTKILKEKTLKIHAFNFCDDVIMV